MSDEIGQLVGANLRRLREAAAITQADLASRIGKTVETISNFERGKTTPSLRSVQDLAQALGCSVADLFNGSERPALETEAAVVGRTIVSLPAADRALVLRIIALFAARS